MENTPYLYDTLLGVLGQHSNWLDLRHCKTLAWMMVGLICSKTVSLGVWTFCVVSQAQFLALPATGNASRGSSPPCVSCPDPVDSPGSRHLQSQDAQVRPGREGRRGWAPADTRA